MIPEHIRGKWPAVMRGSLDESRASPSETTSSGNVLQIALLLLLLSIAADSASAFGWCVGNRARWQAAVAGLFGNFWPLLLTSYLSFVALRRFPRLLTLVLALELCLGSLGMVACVEFALERGTPLSPIDVAQGLNLGFLQSELPLLLSPRFGPFLALGLGLLALALVRLRAALRRQSSSFRIRHNLQLALVVLALSAATHLVRSTARGEFASRPYGRLLGSGIALNGHNMLAGVEEELGELHATEDQARRGLPWFGLRTVSCSDGLHVSETLASDDDAQGRLTPWRKLSASLGALGRPLAFTFVLLESVGAEDVHGLDASAPAGLTPFLDSLTTSEQALTMRRLFQAGQRTAYAMSALLCGTGTSPGLWAPLRDLSHLNLRCWTNLAHDAGMSARFFYGEDLGFDRYRGMLEEHGFDYLHVARIAGRKRGGWGLSDRELFADVLDDLNADRVDGAHGVVRGMLTLSTHAPFTTPEDMPASHEARALSLARSVTDKPDGPAHWTTVSYLDDALSRFLPELMAAELRHGRTPIVLLVGDHTSGLAVGHEASTTYRIPGLWLLPPGVDPALVADVQRDFDTQVWSQNDLARLALHLLEETGSLRELPEAQRWHTMGGQVLAEFRPPPPYSQARIWSLDTLAHARLLDASGRVLAEEALLAPNTSKDLQSVKLAKDAVGAMAWLVEHPRSRGPCVASDHRAP